MLKKTKLILFVSIFSSAASSTVFSDGPDSECRKTDSGDSQEAFKNLLGLIRCGFGNLEILNMLADGSIGLGLMNYIEKLNLSNCELFEKSQEEINRLFVGISKLQNLIEIDLSDNSLETLKGQNSFLRIMEHIVFSNIKIINFGRNCTIPKDVRENLELWGFEPDYSVSGKFLRFR
jgi:hypothetical protein